MTLAIITARSNSSRIPNKVLAEVCGHTLLYWIIQRLGKCKKVDEIILATPERDPLIELVSGIRCATGSTEDVLERIYTVAAQRDAEKVLRITADLPFLSYEGVDAMIEALTPDLDYVNNVYGEYRWLDGTQAEVAWMDAISRANRMAPRDQTIYQTHANVSVGGTWREHGLYWLANSKDFLQKFIEHDRYSADLPHVLVDEPNDLKVAELVMKEVLRRGDSYETLLDIVKENETDIRALRAS